MTRFLTLGILCSTFMFGHSQNYIANYSVAKEEVLRSIPQAYIDKARNDFNIAYWHTSHGTHVYYGLCGLQDYKLGDNELFGITNNNPTSNKLDFHDIYGYDLSTGETAFIQRTRDYLDDPVNAEINTVMWSWCNIAGHDVANNYLPGMQTLINEYGDGGSKIGAGVGQRKVPVNFIFMTGHANYKNNIGEGKPKNQADLITDYCSANGYFCLDYYSIDTHCMNDNYWSDSGDDGNSALYGGSYKFYQDFQNLKTVGNGYFENKSSPGGNVTYGAHNTQHITANRKAYAMWYILARLAGWDGENENNDTEVDNDDQFYFNSEDNTIVIIDDNFINKAICRIYSLTGQIVVQQTIDSYIINLNGVDSGIYIVSIQSGKLKIVKKILIS